MQLSNRQQTCLQAVCLLSAGFLGFAGAYYLGSGGNKLADGLGTCLQGVVLGAMAYWFGFVAYPESTRRD